EDYDAACFAVCAWIDETIMNSSWEHRQLWMKEPLQLRFYQTTNAGELFFERLGGLGVHQREAREVYYLCLAMGFMGRFVREEDRFLLDQLKTSNLKVLTGSSLGTPQLSSQALFPEAYPTGEAPSRKGAGRGLPLILTAAVAAVPVVLFVVLAVVYSFVLGNVADALFTPRP
ncbi:MAG TPA: DotU family type IV/VI secretion system protein, partial [Deltaproteobacteria bacterium]|nr:DotU family type IV/VI secretion system protein [Deltaproteobacteria bacterium]